MKATTSLTDYLLAGKDPIGILRAYTRRGTIAHMEHTSGDRDDMVDVIYINGEKDRIDGKYIQVDYNSAVEFQGNIRVDVCLN